MLRPIDRTLSRYLGSLERADPLDEAQHVACVLANR